MTHFLLGLCFFLMFAGCGKDRKEAAGIDPVESHPDPTTIEPPATPLSGDAEGSTEGGSASAPVSSGKDKPSGIDEGDGREQTLPYSLVELNLATEVAIRSFPRVSGTILRDRNDIVSFKSWISPKNDIWIKFIYDNRHQQDQPEQAEVYFWCHYHGTKMACHGRGKNTIPYDQINEPS
jgi:hypothetical protein